MKNKLSSLLISATLVIGLAACSTPSGSTTPENTDHKADTSKTEAQANFICPMGKECGYSDVAGKCNSCGMDLVAAK